MDVFDSKEAERVESDIVSLLRSARLVVEIGIDRESPLVSDAKVVALHYLVNQRPKELGAYYPGCLAVFLVSEGIFHYQSGAFWPQIRALDGYDQNKLNDMRTAWLAALRKLGLDDFQDVVKSESSLTYVLPALLHGGVPAHSAPEMWKVLLADLQNGIDEPSQVMARWKTSTAVAQQLDKPVLRFVQYGGALASDLLQRMIDLVLDYQGDLIADVKFDAEDVAKKSGVPAHIVEPLGILESPRLRRGSRLPTPVVILDPYSGGGPELRLPAVPSAAVRSGWRVATPSVSNIPTSPYEARTINLSPPVVNWNVAIVDSHQSNRQWTFEGVKSVNAFLFDPHSAALLPDQSRIRGTRVIVLLGPGVKVANQDGSAIPEYEDGLQLFGDWSTWKLLMLDLSAVSCVTISNPASIMSGAVTADIRVIFNGQPPRIVESPIGNVVTAQGDLVFASPPSLDFSQSMLDGVAWSASFRHVNGFTSTIALDELPIEGSVYRTAEWLSQFGTSLAGTLLVRGALGSDLRQSFAVVSGLSIGVPPRIIHPKERVSIPISVASGQLNSQSKKLTVVFDESEVAQEILFTDGEFSQMTIVSIARVQWALRSSQNHRNTMASEIVSVALREIEDGSIAGLSVRTGSPKEISLDLCREDEVLQRSQRVMSAGRDGRALFSLSEFIDSIAQSGESRLTLRLQIDGLRFDVASILTDFEASIESVVANLESVDGLSHISVAWSETRPMKGREIRFWPLHRPWEKPVGVTVDDDAPCAVEVDFLDELLPGRYLCEIALRDDWAPSQRPSLTASNCRDFPLGDVEQRHQRWLRLNPTDPGNALELMLADVEQDAEDLQEIDLIENIGLLVEALRVSGRDRRTNNPIPGKAFKYLTALATKTPRITLTLLRELELLEEAVYREHCLQLIPDIYEVRQCWSSSEDFYQLWTLAPELAALVSLGGLDDDGRLQEWFEFVGWPEPDVELDEFEVGEPDCRGSINAQLIELPEEQLRQIRDELVTDGMKWLSNARFANAAVELLLVIKRRENVVKEWCLAWQAVLETTPPTELTHRRALESVKPKTGQHRYSAVPQILLMSSMDLVKSKGRQIRSVELLFSGLGFSPELTRRSIIAAAACEFFEQRTKANGS